MEMDQKLKSVETKIKIGDFVQGGIVFWVNPSGENFKVINIFKNTNIEWSNVIDEEVGLLAQSDTNGAKNTEAIIQQAGHLNSAASLCAGIGRGGYKDWYLPAANEVDLIMQYKDLIGRKSGESGGDDFSETKYLWSSTEKDTLFAWLYNIEGAKIDSHKDEKLEVRAVREISTNDLTKIF